jgi:hypothetical protein
MRILNATILVVTTLFLGGSLAPPPADAAVTRTTRH